MRAGPIRRDYQEGDIIVIGGEFWRHTGIAGDRLHKGWEIEMGPDGRWHPAEPGENLQEGREDGQKKP